MGKTGTWLALLLASAFFLLYFTDVASGIDEKLALKVIAVKILIYFVWLCFSFFILLSYFEKQNLDTQNKVSDEPKDNLNAYEWLPEEDQYHDPPLENEDDDEIEEQFQ
ncbi:MAG: hypothetical protein AAB847_01355 [Patescibacteria group bacterium]